MEMNTKNLKTVSGDTGTRDSDPELAGLALINALRWQLHINQLKIMWRENRILIVFHLIFVLFFAIFIVLVDELRFLSMFLVVLGVLLAAVMFDLMYHSIYRMTLFHRADLNHMYSAPLPRRPIVFNNLKRYIALNIFTALFLFCCIAVMPRMLENNGLDLMDAGLLIGFLFSMKLVMYTIYNLNETTRRRDRFGLPEMLLLWPIRVASAWIFISFYGFIIFITFTEDLFPFILLLEYPAAALAIPMNLILAAFCWHRLILPHMDAYWHEDRITPPLLLSSRAYAQRTSLFGEESRELDSRSDSMRQYLLLPWNWFRMSEKGTGLHAITGKCNIVFWRSHFNLFVSLAVPLLIFEIIMAFFIGDEILYELLPGTVIVILLLILFTALALRNPINQDTTRLENIRVLPFPSKRIVGAVFLRTITSALAFTTALLLFSLLLSQGFPDKRFVRTSLILVAATVALTIFINTAGFHIRHRFYPRQMERTMARAFPFLLCYLMMILGFSIVTMGEIMCEPLVDHLFAALTVAICILGIKASHYFYETMSIMR